MNKFIKKLYNLNGKTIQIVTTHKWFGKDEYKCELNLINDERRIGFKLLDSEIYLLKDEVRFFGELGGIFCFRDNLMEIVMIHM